MHLIWTQLPLKPTDPTAAAHQPSSSSLIRSSNNLVVVNNKAYVFGGEGKPREPVDDELWEIDLKGRQGLFRDY
jgi:alkyl sulfatase BDS1-like metallo-beta-lactamase superfamily hydrolase